MHGILNNFFFSGPFIPHGHCYLWKPSLVWLHLLSDGLIALAYYSIPLTLFYFVRRRPDLPFHWIFLLFAAFIVACGTTHVAEIWTLWHPTYWLSGAIKAITAAVSVFTAIQLVPLVPQALALPSPAQLEQANRELQVQIKERLWVEEELRHSQNQLEQRVQERTSELVHANEQLQQEIQEHQRTEQALRESRERLLLAQRAAKVGTWEWNLQTGRVSWSEGIWNLLGLDQAIEPDLQLWVDCIHPDDRDRAVCNVEAVFSQGEDYYDEFRAVQEDGSVHWLASKGQIIRDANGQAERFLGVNIDIGDRKQAEEALEANLSQLEAVFNSMTEGLIIADPQGNVLTFNPAALAIHGFQSVEEVRQHVHSFADLFEVRGLDGQPIAVADWPISDAMAGETFSGQRLQIHRTDTGKRWVAQYGGTPVRNKAGEVILAIVTTSDITAQFEAEEVLRASEERFQAFMAHSPTAAWITDANGQILYLSPTYFRVFKVLTDNAVGKRMSDLYETNYANKFLNSIRTVARTNQVIEAIESAPRPDGTLGDFLIYQFPISNSVGQPLVGGVAIDITERKRAETAIANLNRDLQNRLNELQTLFEVVPIGILISQDPEFRYVKANPAFARILGIPEDANISYTPSSSESQPSYKIFRNGTELVANEFPLRYAAIHNVAVDDDEVEIVRGDGTVFNLFGYAAPLLDEQGNARGSVAAFLDITDRKRTEAERENLLERERVAREAAEAANRIKDEFLAVLSHELRTPLNPILGWTRLLRTGNLDAQKTALALETIERNAKLQTQLIEDLLDISRILQGKLSLNVCSVDLAVTIEAAKETVRLAAEAKSIHLHTQIELTTKQVMGDPNRLQQVVWNLLSNAVKFTPSGGRVEVKLDYLDSQAQIQVKDTGKGISREFLPYVFEYFRQEDGKTTRKFGGLGLGLAIVRHIVEMHGGSVDAESEGEGKGATFTVKLPLMNGVPIAHSDGQPLAEPDNLNDLRILVIDDELDARKLVRFILEQAGAEVIATASALEALDALKQFKPDVLLSDIGMPDMDGYTLLRQVRTLPSEQGGHIPAIALTAYAGEINRQRVLAAGFQVHLAKPVEPEELIKTIAALVRKDTSG